MKFRPHGTASFKVEGNFYVWRAIGPFNKEFFCKMINDNLVQYREMSESGPWAMLGIISESALLTPDTIAYLSSTLPKLSAETNYLASAWVIRPEVEGHGILDQVIETIARDVPRIAFDDEQIARSWLDEIAAIH